jgi:hypothetical protein
VGWHHPPLVARSPCHSGAPQKTPQLVRRKKRHNLCVAKTPQLVRRKNATTVRRKKRHNGAAQKTPQLVVFFAAACTFRHGWSVLPQLVGWNSARVVLCPTLPGRNNFRHKLWRSRQELHVSPRVECFATTCGLGLRSWRFVSNASGPQQFPPQVVAFTSRAARFATGGVFRHNLWVGTPLVAVRAEREGLKCKKRHKLWRQVAVIPAGSTVSGLWKYSTTGAAPYRFVSRSRHSSLYTTSACARESHR